MFNTTDTNIQHPEQQNDCYRRDYHFPSLMTESELIHFLRISEISKGKHKNVVENLRRMHDLPFMKISRVRLYPLKSILEWIDQQCEKEKSR